MLLVEGGGARFFSRNLPRIWEWILKANKILFILKLEKVRGPPFPTFFIVKLLTWPLLHPGASKPLKDQG